VLPRGPEPPEEPAGKPAGDVAPHDPAAAVPNLAALPVGAIARDCDPDGASIELQPDRGPPLLDRLGPRGGDLASGEPTSEVDEMRTEVEQGVPRADVGIPGGAFVGELERQGEWPRGRNTRLETLQRGLEAAVEPDPGVRLEPGELPRLAGVGGGRLLDEDRQPRLRGEGGVATTSASGPASATSASRESKAGTPGATAAQRAGSMSATATSSTPAARASAGM